MSRLMGTVQTEDTPTAPSPHLKHTSLEAGAEWRTAEQDRIAGNALDTVGVPHVHLASSSRTHGFQLVCGFPEQWLHFPASFAATGGHGAESEAMRHARNEVGQF